MNFSIALSTDYIDSLYQLWKSQPDQVSREWQLFFEGFEFAGFPEAKPAEDYAKDLAVKQSHVVELIHRYRDLGHLLSCLDPLVSCPTDHPLLSLSAFGLSEEDLDRTFCTLDFPHLEHARLRDIVQVLRETYCRTIGVEYMHLQDPHERRWLQERMEPVRNRPPLEGESKIRILNKLCQATLFEQFIHTKYIGQKRFSAEGAEAVVAMLDMLIQIAADEGCREIILGMAHRGRLNVQVNVLGKPYETILCEFEDNYDPESLVGAGDVKYHTGYLGDLDMGNGRTVRVLMANNPSHLESVDPVVEGIARARQEQLDDHEHKLVLPLLIHGDAAFSGQGVVSETLNLSQLEGYRTGGTLHIVINNQIGFTTLPEDARSTRYSTDIAKMLMVPIFHVHGEDPEAVVHVTKLAYDYRRTFGKDVVIDLVCYRRYGHNEGDEPYYTQPQMYDRIRERPPLYELYAAKLMEEGLVSEDDVERIKEGIRQCLDAAYQEAHEKTCVPPPFHFFESWKGIHGNYSHEPVKTGVDEETLIDLGGKIHAAPEGFTVHSRLERIFKRQSEAVQRGEGIDWATAEALAFASLLVQGVPVRLSGQDSRRGTFSQRHSVLVDPKTGEHLTPLNAIKDGQARFSAFDSMLSENAILGFDYGYSLGAPHSLVLWEAQFGDFANNAQVMIDQYISSAETKWQLLSGLVLLLPHGFEGQGPEHSSARLERYLQLCAEDNIQVCNPTTPAQYFHLLRRQVMRDFRKPLIVMTPKSLLRHPLAVSRLEEMVHGRFYEVLGDEENVREPKRVLICSGKITYDLLERRQKEPSTDCAILRLEQLYPFPEAQVKEAISAYAHAKEWYWVQEEPRNMGAWSFVRERLKALVGRDPTYIGRPEAASPAKGLFKIFKMEQAAIVDQALS